ncbi:probable ADP-ribosylation factor GTPase-activating protein AGD14 [Typha angustifolia]|uniref:probable ADP-ribosylation factor GTPase-activating protein AGD14 n=1 Tax=Typha angustifolia TaxID=59011 RepID=UPI003C2E48E0
MSSKKEEERNEKIIRGLMKLPPNRRCFNCNSLGPQYVCTNFWTFVCMTCGGIHREFTHRVKSVSMAKFTKQEVEALQNGGNQRAREIFLKGWDIQRMRLPNNSNADKIREFIRNVYVNKKYAEGGSFEKPPGDMEGLKNNDEDERRASSYHSYSQSPPYDFQYEDRRYGKQTGMLTRRTGSERVLYQSKISSFLHSPGHPREQIHEDRFANESPGSRFSDSSVSSSVDQSKYDGQSPNSQDTGYYSPPVRQARDILVEDLQNQTLKYSGAAVRRDSDEIQQPQRTASSGNLGSFDSNSVSRKSADSGSLADVTLEPVHYTGMQQAVVAPLPPSEQSFSSLHETNQPFFNQTVVQQPTNSYSSLDLFAGFSHQPSSMIPLEQKPSPTSLPENDGWATFDLPEHTGAASGANKQFLVGSTPADTVPRGTDGLTSQISVQNSWASGPIPLTANQRNLVAQEAKGPMDQESMQHWNAFDDSTGKVHHGLLGNLPHNDKPEISVCEFSSYVNPYPGHESSKDLVKERFEWSNLDDLGPGLDLTSGSMAGSAYPSFLQPMPGVSSQVRKSTNPFDIPYESDLEANTVILNMSNLQAALPDLQVPAANTSNLAEPWFPQNSTTTYIPSLHQGGLAYMTEQAPDSQMPNLSHQGPVASFGGNPFA